MQQLYHKTTCHQLNCFLKLFLFLLSLLHCCRLLLLLYKVSCCQHCSIWATIYAVDIHCPALLCSCTVANCTSWLFLWIEFLIHCCCCHSLCFSTRSADTQYHHCCCCCWLILILYYFYLAAAVREKACCMAWLLLMPMPLPANTVAITAASIVCLDIPLVICNQLIVALEINLFCCGNHILPMPHATTAICCCLLLVDCCLFDH